MDMLPLDLIEHITMLNASGIICAAWRRYLIKKQASLIILSNLVSLPEIDAMSPYTCDVMEHCLKFVSLRGDYNLSHQLFAKLDTAIIFDEYTGGQGAIYYNKTESLYTQYLDKLYNETLL